MSFLDWLVAGLITKYFTGHNLIDNSALKHVSIVQSLEFDVGLDTHLGIREWFSTMNLKHNVICMSWAHTTYLNSLFQFSTGCPSHSYMYNVIIIIRTKEIMIQNYIQYTQTPVSDGKKIVPTYRQQVLVSKKVKSHYAEIT